MVSSKPVSNPIVAPIVSFHSSPNSASRTPSHIYRILVGQLFDSVSRVLVPKQVITVDRETGIILDVGPLAEARKEWGKDVEVTRIDLSHLTLLPGLVDVHVHLFLHPYSEVSWDDQLMKESLAERTVRATMHARRTLQAGFTTVRDLGTEGAFDADIGLRKCLSGKNPIIPGPRYYCATRAIISTGSYGPKSSIYPSQEGIDGIHGAVPVDGIEPCIREVRKQIGAGADWIKIYGDYRCRSRMADVSSHLSAGTIPTFSKAELAVMVNEAHDRGVKVAVHANTAQVVKTLIDLEVDSIEHGAEIFDRCTGDRTLLRKLHASTATWVPTLAAYYTMSQNSPYSAGQWDRCVATFQEAVKLGIENIACGGDTGVFAHGENALELILMRRLGASWDRVLSWATYGGWKCIRGMEWDGEEGGKCLSGVANDKEVELDRGVPFGVIRSGWAADFVGVEGPLEGTVEDFERTITDGVKFVMKGGVIFKNDGYEVPAI